MWICLGAFLFIVELVNPGLYYGLSCALGAFFAGGVAVYADNIVYQIAAWMLSSLGSFFFLRMVGNRYAAKGAHTNYEALLGKKGIVQQNTGETIPARVKIQGDSWPAREVHGKNLCKGDHVQVVDLRGNTLIVQIVDLKK